MIFYDEMNEGSSDEDDEDFFVDFTPEGDRFEIDLKFETRKEFYVWLKGEDDEI